MAKPAKKASSPKDNNVIQFNTEQSSPSDTVSVAVEPKKRSRSYLTFYVVGLLSVFAALVFMSYLSQQKAQDANTEALTQHSEFSLNAMKSISALQEENASLIQERDQIQEQLDTLLDQFAQLQVELSSAHKQNTELTQRLDAMTQQYTELKTQFDLGAELNAG